MINNMKDLNLKNQEIREFFQFKISHLQESTQVRKVLYLSNFCKAVDFQTSVHLCREDINNYLNESNFANLANITKNTRLSTIRQFLLFTERDDLVKILPEYRVKNKELDKTKLVTRTDLKKLLKICKNIRERTLLMVLYESAARRSEITAILREDLVLHENFAEVWIGESKTTKRNLTLIESVPFLEEYLEKYEINPSQPLFLYADSNGIYKFIERLEEKAKKASLDKHFYPHLFRHSRLTELANNRKLNEPQLRKFAGWSNDSTMPATYFHLDDSDLRNELLAQQGIKEEDDKKKLEFKSILCPQCTERNNKFNELCWNCGAILEKTKEEDVDLKNQVQELQKIVFKLIEDKEKRAEKLRNLEKQL